MLTYLILVFFSLQTSLQTQQSYTNSLFLAGTAVEAQQPDLKLSPYLASLMRWLQHGISYAPGHALVTLLTAISELPHTFRVPASFAGVGVAQG